MLLTQCKVFVQSICVGEDQQAGKQQHMFYLPVCNKATISAEKHCNLESTVHVCIPDEAAGLGEAAGLALGEATGVVPGEAAGVMPEDAAGGTPAVQCTRNFDV